MAKKTAKKTASKAATKPAPAARKGTKKKRKGPKMTACSIAEVVPCEFRIRDQAREAEIRGEALDTAGLKAKIFAVSGNGSDPAIRVEQPLPDDVTPKKFRITITVLDGAKEGCRTVAMLLNGTEVCRLRDAIDIIG